MPRRRTEQRPLVLALLLATATAAQAQDDRPPPASGGMVGLMVGSAYQYLGSDERRTDLLPTFEYRWANGWMAGVRGIGYRFGSTPGLEYGLGLGWDGGRKESRSDALRGMGTIKTRAEATGFARWQLTPGLALDGDLRYGAGNDSRGLQASLGLSYGFELAPGWRLGSKLSATWTNSHYMQDYFGVDAAQSARSGYASYQAGAGLRDLRLGLSLNHPINRDWMLGLGVEQMQLLGDAKRSPLVREAQPLSGRLMLGYRF